MNCINRMATYLVICACAPLGLALLVMAAWQASESSAPEGERYRGGARGHCCVAVTYNCAGPTTSCQSILCTSPPNPTCPAGSVEYSSNNTLTYTKCDCNQNSGAATCS